MVLLEIIAFSNILRDSGPASIPSHPFGILSIGQTFLFALLEKLSAHTTSKGNRISTLFFFADFKIDKARGILSSSQIEFPISPP